MKKVSICICAAFLFFGCSSNEQTTETSETMTAETDTTAAVDAPMEESKPDIVALASNTPSLSTLVKALQAAELVGTLQQGGPYTVFAPTDEAFAALPAGTLDNLMKPENKQQLIDILTYHVSEGSTMSSGLSDGMMVKSLNGKDLKVMINGDKVMLNDATVTMPNVEASNGVVHVIDKVILPPSN